jgi:SAM-dependent methyltransferase
MIRLGARTLSRRGIAVGAQRPVSEIAGTDLEREFGPAPLAHDEQSVTRLLYERLSDEDVAEAERTIAATAELKSASLDEIEPAARRQIVVSYGMWLGVASVAAKTGLVPAQPPDDVHAMARGPLAAAGGLYEADLVVDALSSVGVSAGDVDNALDFGCSSARVVRVLAAAYPAVRWLGCDPNEPAIAWASKHLPGIDFFISRQEPPLAIAQGSLDLVYAISIWSHFAPDLGLRWFDEMHRIIRPGGHLVCTTHGMTSIAFFASTGVRTAAQSTAIAEALYRRGWWYAAEFGEQGDWGVRNPAWGTAFLSPEWLLAKLCPLWRVSEFAPGRNQANQDVYVLERV